MWLWMKVSGPAICQVGCVCGSDVVIGILLWLRKIILDITGNDRVNTIVVHYPLDRMARTVKVLLL
jgi:hypothetical protein